MAKPPFLVKALYDYKSPHEDDLGFPSAQIITVTDEEDNDWYYGEYEDVNGKKQEGLFPRNFVKSYEPETPPRPNKQSRAKKDVEPIPKAVDGEEPPGLEDLPEAAPRASSFQPLPGGDSKDQEEGGDTEPELESQASTKPPRPAASVASREAKPPPITSKGPPPPITEKPVSGSFRDRINAFNKTSAPPPAPSKPAGLGGSAGSSFIRKPFVAPPPSKNAYVPPPRQDAPHKVYRREEDPEVVAQASRDADEEEQPPSQAYIPQLEDSANQPKPTSLKERIALLQKQQAEQASRHAEKKEKPKRPPKKQEADQLPPENEDEEGENLERAKSNETTGRKSVDASRDARSSARPRKSREETAGGGFITFPPREVFSDGNDADQSGAADTGEEEDQSTSRDDSDEKPQRHASIGHQQLPQPLSREPKSVEPEGEIDYEEEDDGDDDVDPEMKRRIEIRERMAKMSGGMGMAGMFGPPTGMPQARAPTKQSSGSSERKTSGNSKYEPTADASRAPPVPSMPMPGLTKVKSPENIAPTQNPPEVEQQESEEPRSIVQDSDSEEMLDNEDLNEEPTSTRRSTDRTAPPARPSQAREVPALPGQSRGVPPLLAERPVPPPPAAPRPMPPTPSQPISPSEGSISDDEMPSHARNASLDETMTSDDPNPSIRGPRPPVPLGALPPAMPNRPKATQSRQPDYGVEGVGVSTQASPTSPSEKRASRFPPLPGASPNMPSAPQNRAPPPPPPTGAPAPPSRSSTFNSRGPPVIANSRDAEASDEVTEYDGDYDTDMASGATHRDALKSHGRVSSADDESMTEGEAAMHHIGLPSMGPGPSLMAPRAVPPLPPPAQPPRPTRQSADMPRAAPPPPPRPKERNFEDQDSEYDPYNYAPGPGPRAMSGRGQIVTTPTIEQPESIYNTPSPQRSVPTPGEPPDQYATSSNMVVPGRSAPRASGDMKRSSTSIQRSTDAPRQSGEHGTIATDVDLGSGSGWWTVPDAPPPVFQNRRDVLFETEDASIVKRGGKQAITRTVYVLFMDYSQTMITAQYEAHSPTSANLEQSHEPPPRSLRQDQLEDAHSKFGAQVAKGVDARKETVVGDSSPHALPLDLISALPDALLPVGNRAYGGIVYANLANASVQQFDEIRPGDIVTFRNAKFQGHRGTMHSKYSMDVGKPDHAAVVLDWDGTKKKVRAWEQGRESKKVKLESFKFGDMKSGEVKVWRVMPRSWVGWEGQN